MAYASDEQAYNLNAVSSLALTDVVVVCQGTNPATMATFTQVATVLSTKFAQSLALQSVKTGAFTAAPGQQIPTNTTSGNVPITLPTAPPDQSRIGIKMVVQGGTNTTSYTCGGSDVLNVAGGSTSGTLKIANQGVILEYNAAGAIWTVVSDDLPLGSLDLRYVAATSGTVSALTVNTHFPTTTTDTPGSTVTFNLATSDEHVITLGASSTFAISNATVNQRFTIKVIQAASGGPYTITWFSGITWFTNTFTAPTMPTTASGAMLCTFKCTSSGQYDGFWCGNSTT